MRLVLLPGNMIESPARARSQKSNVWIHLAFIPWTVGVRIHGWPFCFDHSEIGSSCQEAKIKHAASVRLLRGPLLLAFGFFFRLLLQHI
jgi:hypothetical protein